jgi:hypothetical protein
MSSFTQEEAEAKVGKKIRMKVKLSRVPEGTTGNVLRADDMRKGKWGTVIRWNLPKKTFLREFLLMTGL